jgi:eukaryotic-like serine/threonine-protein kinase
VSTLLRDPTVESGAAAPVASSKPFLSPGLRVGRYRVHRPLGNGSMGEVYLASDDELGRRAAIKVLGSKHLTNPTVKERFLREARALAGLSHPNVIPVFESGQVGRPPRPYYAMELLEGGDTQTLLDERGPLPSGVVAVIGAQAATGLGEAARAQLIHRDVKPSNLGISRQGVLKVTDFGLAKMSSVDQKLTGKGLVVGTADYIAPEQARGEEVDERADVYALGCTLFHLLTGHPPFRSSQPTPVQQFVEVMRAHVGSPIPDPRRDAPDADPELAQVIMLMMAKEREQRPAFSEAAPLLSRIALRLGGELPRVSRQIFTVPFGTPILPEQRPESGRFPSQRWRTLAAFAALVFSAVALMLSLWHQR